MKKQSIGTTGTEGKTIQAVGVGKTVVQQAVFVEILQIALVNALIGPHSRGGPYALIHQVRIYSLPGDIPFKSRVFHPAFLLFQAQFYLQGFSFVFQQKFFPFSQGKLHFHVALYSKRCLRSFDQDNRFVALVIDNKIQRSNIPGNMYKLIIGENIRSLLGE
jgi:hypothetical protein